MQEFITGVTIGMLIVGIVVVVSLVVKQLLKSKISMRDLLKKWPFWLIVIMMLLGLKDLNFPKVDSTYGYVVKTANVMNGIKTEVIGEYGYIEINKSELTSDMMVHIYREEIEKDKYNWFTVRFEDGTGVQFIGSTMLAVYGKLDEEDCVEQDDYLIMPTFSNEVLSGFKLDVDK